MNRAVHRLHRRVREERNLVGRLDLGGGARHGLVDIADVLRDRARLERRLFELGRDRLGVELGVRTVVPFDHQRRQPLLRRAHMVGHDRDGVVEPHDLAHALDGLGRRIVHALHATAEDGRLRERRDLHARRPSVDAIDGRSVDLRRRVEPLGRRADSLKSSGRLSATFSGTGMRAASAASSPYLSVVRSARAALRRFARGRTPDRHSSAWPPPPPAWFARSHRLGAAAATPPRIAFELPVACTPQQRIAVELLVGRRMLQPHLVQVHLQLFGDQHRDRGVGALAHLDIGHGQDNLPVAADADEGVGREASASAASASPCERQAEAQHQAAARGRAGLQEARRERSSPIAVGGDRR